MHITPTYITLTEEEKAEKAKRMEEEAATRKLALEAEEVAAAKANGTTVSLSSMSAMFLAEYFNAMTDDQRIRKSIRWGVVEGLFIYTLAMIPVSIVAAIILAGLGKL
jgi:hypothetical protein